MAMTRGNRIAKPRQRRNPTPKTLAIYIAESIAAHIMEGNAWTFEQYGTSKETIEMVKVNLTIMGVDYHKN